VDNNIIFKVTR